MLENTLQSFNQKIAKQSLLIEKLSQLLPNSSGSNMPFPQFQFQQPQKHRAEDDSYTQQANKIARYSSDMSIQTFNMNMPSPPMAQPRSGTQSQSTSPFSNIAAKTREMQELSQVPNLMTGSLSPSSNNTFNDSSNSNQQDPEKLKSDRYICF